MKKNFILCVLMAAVAIFSYMAGDNLIFNEPNVRYVNNQNLTAKNLGIPCKDYYYESSDRLYARNIWDMKTFDNKVFMGFGDYQNNTGDTPIYYYKNDSLKKYDIKMFEDDNYEVSGLPTEQISRFFEIDNELYTVSTDPTNWMVGEFYKLENNRWKTYRKLDNCIHLYDMIKYDGKIFFGGAWYKLEDGYQKNIGIVQSIDADKLTDKKTKTNFVPFYKDNFLIEKGELYRCYDLFTYKNELYAISYLNGDTIYDGLFKYNAKSNRFDYQKSDEKNGITAVIQNRSKFNGFTLNYYKKGIENVFSEPMLYAKFDLGDKFVAVCNDIFVSTDLNTFKKASLGEKYKNFVVRDAVEFDNRYYFVASEKKGNTEYNNVLFETNDFKNFRTVGSFKTKAFVRSIEFLDNSLYIGCGSYSPSADDEKEQVNKYNGTLYRIDF